MHGASEGNASWRACALRSAGKTASRRGPRGARCCERVSVGTGKTDMNFRRIWPETRCQICLLGWACGPRNFHEPGKRTSATGLGKLGPKNGRAKSDCGRLYALAL